MVIRYVQLSRIFCNLASSFEVETLPSVGAAAQRLRERPVDAVFVVNGATRRPSEQALRRIRIAAGDVALALVSDSPNGRRGSGSAVAHHIPRTSLSNEALDHVAERARLLRELRELVTRYGTEFEKEAVFGSPAGAEAPGLTPGGLPPVDGPSGPSALEPAAPGASVTPAAQMAAKVAQVKRLPPRLLAQMKALARRGDAEAQALLTAAGISWEKIG